MGKKETSMKTLIVEDDFTSRLLLQTVLARYGECHIAVNGKEAVAAFRIATSNGSPYNLICMDVMMPEMNGQDAVKQVRALEELHGVISTHGAKIIMTTAVNDVPSVLLSFKDLCDAYLFKPIDIAKLLHEIKTFGLVA